MNDIDVLRRMDEMCVESLPPALHEDWERIQEMLLNTRMSLRQYCKKCSHPVELAWHFCPECGQMTREPVRELQG